MPVRRLVTTFLCTTEALMSPIQCQLIEATESPMTVRSVIVSSTMRRYLRHISTPRPRPEQHQSFPAVRLPILMVVVWISCVVLNPEVPGQTTTGKATQKSLSVSESRSDTGNEPLENAAASKTTAPPAKVSSETADTVVSFPVGTRTGEKWNDNRLKIEFLWCESGSFTMGSPKGEKDRVDNEDQVQVTLTRGFWLGKYEVTQEQWRSVMNTDPWLDHRRVRIAEDSPACWLSWEDANLFCRELTRVEREAGGLPEGWAYVLPTEA